MNTPEQGASWFEIIKNLAAIIEEKNALQKELDAYKRTYEGRTCHACPCCGGTVVGKKDFAGGV